MYKETPWTLEKTKTKRTRKSHYIKERQADLAISTSRVMELFEKNKEKVFNNCEIAELLNLSVGTVSSITNRLVALGDIKAVYITKPYLAQVFQHISGSRPSVPFMYFKEDTVVSILNLFANNKNEIYTKKDLLKKFNYSEGMTIKSLQILLCNENIKLVGNDENGQAQYQHKDGKSKGYKVYTEAHEKYSSLNKFLKENKLEQRKKDFIKHLKNQNFRFYYTTRGIIKEYLIEDLNKITKNLDKKNMLSKLFK